MVEIEVDRVAQLALMCANHRAPPLKANPILRERNISSVLFTGPDYTPAALTMRRRRFADPGGQMRRSSDLRPTSREGRDIACASSWLVIVARRKP